MARVVNDGSKVQIALPFMLIVIICNLGKATIMLNVLRRTRADHCVTIGDALESFLRRPDSQTVGYCIASGQELTQALAVRLGSPMLRDRLPDNTKGMTWQAHRKRYWATVVENKAEAKISWIVV